MIEFYRRFGPPPVTVAQFRAAAAEIREKGSCCIPDSTQASIILGAILAIDELAARIEALEWRDG